MLFFCDLCELLQQFLNNNIMLKILKRNNTSLVVSFSLYETVTRHIDVLIFRVHAWCQSTGADWQIILAWENYKQTSTPLCRP